MYSTQIIDPAYIPTPVHAALSDVVLSDDILYWYPWITQLKNKNIWLGLSQRWKADGSLPDSPPPGYEYYIITGDSGIFGMAEKVAGHTQGTVIQLAGPILSSVLDKDRVKYLAYTDQHRRINRMPTQWPINKQIVYKVSALTSRITQSKAIVFAALVDLIPRNDLMLSLRHTQWTREKSHCSHIKHVHAWNRSGNIACDRFTDRFIEYFLDVTIDLPNDDRIPGSYNNAAYQNSAVNFTQESYHYSLMCENERTYIQPGPFLTEKTWKCIVSKTAFIPVGQYLSYEWLRQMGMTFDYGELDLSFDQDPGNLTRLEKIVELCHEINRWSAQDLFAMTKDSTEHNYEHVMSKNFWINCEKFNEPTIDFLSKL
jgi:hypothetical protein